ncbi:MAG: TonB-dependent receptor [Ignavibacterium album]|uniref:TonB-dependent receptor n=1 Tax=Ignavibacterium album TaxID=591197 RepID=UPI0026EF7B41|nr:TonB-dependent receptor [Ignavibacterium album]MCX8106311.1 TonB-dependent receptor [Ignavibacterium album]
MRFIIIFFLAISLNLAAQTGTLKGRVTDGRNPIPSVNVFVPELGIGDATNNQGFYTLKNLPARKLEVRFSAVGYETEEIEIEITSNRTTELNVILKETIIEVQTVTVTGLKVQEQKDTRTSLIDLNPKSAKILAGGVEDVFRTLQTLPGVLAPNDFSSQLIVRGSGPDQNLIVMDDIEVFNPYRLYGVISMFNPDAVSDVNLISGGFPAKYGDRLSAVLDVTNREGDITKTFKGNLNVSIVDANIVLEGRNPFNIKGSWLVNSRRTYYDLIIEPFVKNAGLVDDNTSFPNFYDFQAKLVFGPFNGSKILLNGILSRDGVNVISGKDRNTPDSVGVFNITRNDVLGAAWHFAPSKKLLNKVVLSWYKNNGDTDFDSQILDPSLNRTTFEDAIPDTLKPYLLGFKFSGTFDYRKISFDDKFTYLWGDNVFEAGIGFDKMETTIDFIFDLDPQLEAIFRANPQFRAALSDIKDVKRYNRYRAFVQNNFKVTDRFFFNPSLRYDYYDLLDKQYLAPRFSLSYAIDEITTLRAVWGLYYQSPGYEKLRDQNVLFDLDERFTRTLEAEKAIHYVAGIERWLTNEWSLRFESYYKKFDNLIVQKIVPGTRFITEAIPGKDPKLPSSWTRPVPVIGDSVTQIPINNSNGEAYGFEFFLAKRNIERGSKLFGWISYSLAYADRYELGETFPFRFDQRHTVNIVLNYEFNSWFNVGMRWQYGSGFPISIPSGIKPRIIYADSNGDGKLDSPVIATRKPFGNPNAEGEVIYDIDFANQKLNSRKPPYHRLDVRLNFLANFWDLDWNFYLDVVNVYNRKNVVGYDWFITEDLKLDKRQNNMFPILPTLGFAVRF